MYAKHMVDGRLLTVKGEVSDLEKESQVRHLGTESPPWFGAGPHRPSTLTDTRPPCFEVEKHALRLGASAHYLPTNWGPPPRTGLPVNNVRVRGQAGRAHTRNTSVTVYPRGTRRKLWPWGLVTPDPLEVGD